MEENFNTVIFIQVCEVLEYSYMPRCRSDKRHIDTGNRKVLWRTWRIVSKTARLFCSAERSWLLLGRTTHSVGNQWRGTTRPEIRFILLFFGGVVIPLPKLLQFCVCIYTALIINKLWLTPPPFLLKKISGYVRATCTKKIHFLHFVCSKTWAGIYFHSEQNHLISPEICAAFQSRYMSIRALLATC